VFRLSLEFYRLISSSVEAGRIPERSEAGLKATRSSRPRRISAVEPVTDRNCSWNRPAVARAALAVGEPPARNQRAIKRRTLALAQVRPFAKIEQPYRRAFAEPRTTRGWIRRTGSSPVAVACARLPIAVILLGIDGRECPEGFVSAGLRLIRHPIEGRQPAAACMATSSPRSNGAKLTMSAVAPKPSAGWSSWG
jgi:hypothetical protein